MVLAINHFGPLHSLFCFHCHVVLGSRKWPHHLFCVLFCGPNRLCSATELCCLDRSWWTDTTDRLLGCPFLFCVPWCLFGRVDWSLSDSGHLGRFGLFALREEKIRDGVLAVLRQSLSALPRRIRSLAKRATEKVPLGYFCTGSLRNF